MCAIDTSDRLYCWGQNTNGSVGNGTTTQVTTPTLIDSGVSYSKVYVLSDQTCGITTTGVAKCWGANWSGALGTGDWSSHTTPTLVDSGVSYSKLVISTNYRCGLTTGNVVKCWGNMKDISTPATIAYSTATAPQTMFSGATFQDLFGSGAGFCVRDSDNVVSCTGALDQNIAYSAWNNFEPLASWSKWIPDTYYGCGLTTTGVMKCATPMTIALGDYQSDTLFRSISVPVYSVDTYVDFASDNGICAVTSTGKIHCWGVTYTFKWMDISDGNIFMPTKVMNAPTGVKKIAMGGGNICVIDGNDDIQCVGTVASTLGDSSATAGPVYNFTSFVKANTSKKFTSISMAANVVCGISTAQELVCWGALPGDGSGNSSNPVVVDAGTTYQSITVSMYTRCGLTTGGVAKCWGTRNDSLGQLTANGTPVNSPIVADSGTTFKKLQTFQNSQATCGITSSDELRCWSYGMTGIASVPATYFSGTTFSEVYGSGGVACGLTTGGVLKCLTGPQNNSGYYSVLGTGKTKRGFAPLKATQQ